jgi:hypothetical protein
MDYTIHPASKVLNATAILIEFCGENREKILPLALEEDLDTLAQMINEDLDEESEENIESLIAPMMPNLSKELEPGIDKDGHYERG